MKPYTTAATADSTYASGALSKSRIIWTIERDAAATVNTP